MKKNIVLFQTLFFILWNKQPNADLEQCKHRFQINYNLQPYGSYIVADL